MAKKNSEGGGYKRAHVISRSSGWAVKKEGTSRVAKVYFKKDSAVKGAKRLVTCERVHVISRSSRWAVKKEGTFRVAKVYFKKDSAVKGAKRLVILGGDVIIHKKDGSIQKWEQKIK